MEDVIMIRDTYFNGKENLMIPICLFNEMQIYLNKEEQIALINICVFMKEKNVSEVKLTLLDLMEIVGLPAADVQRIMDRIVLFGFFRNIYKEKEIETTDYYLVNTIHYIMDGLDQQSKRCA